MSGLHGLGVSNGVSRSLPAQRFHRGWNMSRMNKQLLNFFRCSLCPEYLLPPIIKCMYGHMVCITCRSKFTRCPICWGPMSGDRNLSLEKLAEVVRFPCRYAFSGCQVRIPYTDKPDHEDLCEFHPYPCPCPSSSCGWQGRLEAMVPHLQDEHKFITELEEEETRIVVEKIELCDAQDWVLMQFCFGFHFLLVLTKQGESNGRDQFFAIVILIGTRKQAEHFTYHVKLVGHRRRLTWDATPSPVQEGIDTAILNKNCFAINLSTARLFAENGNLTVHVTISQSPSQTSGAEGFASFGALQLVQKCNVRPISCFGFAHRTLRQTSWHCREPSW